MNPKPKFQKVDEDSYRVLVDGQVIGTVSRGWWRNGGWGWTNDLAGTNTRVGNRAAAAADLIRRAGAR